MAVRIALGNNKGGVGKTSTTVNVASALARRGRRVLVVDMDPQGNTSRRLGWTYDPDNPQLTVSEAIQSGATGVAAQVIQPTGWNEHWSDRIALCPARLDLENRVAEAGTLDSYLRLAQALDGADDDFDYTLIDCPPSLGHLTHLGLAAAHWAVCVLWCDYDAVEAAVRYRDFVQLKGSSIGNPRLAFLGAILNHLDLRSETQQHHYDSLPTYFTDEQLLKPYIPERVVIADASDAAAPVSAFQRGRKKASAVEILEVFAGLAEQIEKRTTR